MSRAVFLKLANHSVLALLSSGMLFGYASGQEPWELEVDELKKQLAIEYMTELSDRRRLTTIFENQQSVFYGVQVSHINVGRGNLTFLKRDLVRLDLMPVVFGRVYDSRIEGTEEFGPGWKLTVSESIEKRGSTLVYVDSSNSSYELAVQDGRLFSKYPHLTGIKGGTLSASNIRISHLGLKKVFKRHGQTYLLRSVSDSTGNSITINYRGKRVEKISSSSGRFVKIFRDANKKIIGAEDDSGRGVSFTYDVRGQLSSYIDSGGGTWRYSYDNAGKLTKIVDPRDIKILGAEYSNQRVSSIDIQHKSMKFQYRGSRTEVTKANGNSASFWSHQSGLTESAQDFGGQFTSLILNRDLEAEQLSYNGMTVANVRYDDRHRPIKIRRKTSAADEILSMRYGKGGLVKVKNGDNVVAAYRYDKFGAIVDALDDISDRQYIRKPTGEIEQVIVNELPLKLTTNSVGALRKISRNGVPIANFDLNGQDRITSIDAHNDGNTASLSYEYGASGLRSQANYFDTTTLYFDYDAVGNLTKLRGDLGDGERFEDTYNIGPNNSLDSVLAESGPDATFSYDDEGRATRVVHGQRFADIEYDKLGRLVSLDRDGENLFTISYDPMEIDAVEEADVKTRSTYVSHPIASSIFGSLNAIAYARTTGSPHARGAIRFNSTMGRFILSKIPFVVPDSIDIASMKTRMLPIAAESIDVTPLTFDKPSNSMFIPPEYSSVNCVICVGFVAFADIEVNGSDLPTVADIEEVIPFTFTSDSTCLFYRKRAGYWVNYRYRHRVQFGDGSVTAFSTRNENTSYSHAYNSGGTFHVTDVVTCTCNTLFFDFAHHAVVIQSGPNPPAPVEVFLTFDDGPHGATTGNRTITAINALQNNSVQPNTPATFFIQTHVSYRLPSTGGTAATELAIANGHEIGIHTGGSSPDHALHTARVILPPYNSVGGPTSGVDGENALESDLIAAKEAIRNLAGGTIPRVVRAPENNTNHPDIMPTYARQNLDYAAVEVQGDDIPVQNYSTITANLASAVPARVQTGDHSVIVLFHDIRSNTVNSLMTQGTLPGYMQTIKDSVENSGNYTVSFQQFVGN